MNSKIKHEGTIVSIGSDRIEVSIGEQAACAGCKVASQCNASNIKVKQLSVVCPDGTSCYHIGQHVVVAASIRQGLKASFLAFLYPLLIMVGLMFGLHAVGCSDELAVGVALGSIALYFLIMYMTRVKWQSQFSFFVEEAL